jgi:non-ribosomal peptide synthetase component E (peptide arylation enzyme)
MLARAAATASIAARRSVSSSRLAPATATMLVSHLSTKAATAKKSSSKIATPPGGAKLASMTAENPHVDVVKYEHKNRTWTLNHVDYFSKALAIGLTENGLQPGDVVLSWLPDHFSEQASTNIDYNRSSSNTSSSDVSDWLRIGMSPDMLVSLTY